MENQNHPVFDQEKYLRLQTEQILRRVKQFEQLYLEVGGKLIDDLHAKRVLPGFDPTAKLKVLSSLKDRLEVIVCVSAVDLERNKIRSDNHMSYADEAIRLIIFLRQQQIAVNNVVITLFEGQARAEVFANKLKSLQLKVYFHSKTPGYPTDVDLVVSLAGYGQNSFIKTTADIVVVTAPGPSSGKMATCLSQIYHEANRGRRVGYAKYETFPVWDLPMEHPVNVAYEAATLDLKDKNMIDPYHLANYGKTAVNYNRDIETFPVLKRIFDRIYGRELYKSPTDMGVNVISRAIIDDTAVQMAAQQEIIRRYFRTRLEQQLGEVDELTLERAQLLMRRVGVEAGDRLVVRLAMEKYQSLCQARAECEVQTAAIELLDGLTATAKRSAILSPIAALILNILKIIAGIDDKIYLLPPEILEPISKLKSSKLGLTKPELSLEEILLTLTVTAASNPMAKLVLAHLDDLRGAQLHSTGFLSDRDLMICRQLEIDVTIGLVDNYM